MSEAREPETAAGRALSKRVSDLADSADVYLDSESDRVYMDVTDEGILAIEREAAEKALNSAAERVRALEEALTAAFEAMNEACKWAAGETAGIKTIADADRHMAGYDALLAATVQTGQAAGVLSGASE